MNKLIVLLTILTVLTINPAAMALVWNDGLPHTIDTEMPDHIFLDQNMTTPPSPGTHVDIITGGSCMELHAYNNSSVSITGGAANFSLNAYGSSTITMSAGTVGVFGLLASGDSTVTITGGSVNKLFAEVDATVTMSGGSINEAIMVFNSAVIYLEGTGFEVGGQALSYGDKLSDFATSGTITGTLADASYLDNSFSIYNTADIIILPEPATMALLSLGGLLLRRRKA